MPISSTGQTLLLLYYSIGLGYFYISGQAKSQILAKYWLFIFIYLLLLILYFVY